jgi:DNA-binding CsgD family transcriptional regulator
MSDDRSVTTMVKERLDRPADLEILIRWLVTELTAMGVTPTARHQLIAGQEHEQTVLDVEVDGERWCLTRRIVEPVQDPAPSLSPREHEIARMVAKGYANKSIASVLDISSWTVSSHLRRIYAKLGVSSRAAMVARLLESGDGRVPPVPGEPPPRMPASPLRY